MLQWLSSNLSTIVISLLLLAVVFLIVRYLIRQHKQGKHSCGGNCGACGGCAHCDGKTLKRKTAERAAPQFSAFHPSKAAIEYSSGRFSTHSIRMLKFIFCSQKLLDLFTPPA